MSIINNINKLFDHRIRLGIMSVLMVNEYADFKTLKQLLNVTDGNLASHAKALIKANYISTYKQFIANKPNTRYSITTLGKTEFNAHIQALERLLKLQQKTN